MAIQAHPKKRARKHRPGNGKPSVRSLGTMTTHPALELRKRLQLSQPLFARLLAVSVRSLASLESGSPPTEAVGRRLNEVLRLTDALRELMKNESLGKWLQTPNSAFNGLKPLEVIDRGETDRIWAMIYFLRSGVPA